MVLGECDLFRNVAQDYFSGNEAPVQYFIGNQANEQNRKVWGNDLQHNNNKPRTAYKSLGMHCIMRISNAHIQCRFLCKNFANVIGIAVVTAITVTVNPANFSRSPEKSFAWVF